MCIKISVHRAQSIIEYAAVIIVIIAVFIAMTAYYKRSLQGRYREAGDALSAGGQYQYPKFPEGANPYVKH